jgi:hypothetical protein
LDIKDVAGFGKAPAEKHANPVQNGKLEPISNGTVTETGTAGSVAEKGTIEVCGSYGAGDPD